MLTIGRVAKTLEQADCLIIAAGVDLSVDSGLPDFRGTDGFWNAYQAMREVCIKFTKIASPQTFISDPHRNFMFIAWRFTEIRLHTMAFIF